MSAPTNRTVCARPDSSCAAASDRPYMKPVQAAPMSSAPALTVPISWETSGAAAGVTSSAVVVATSSRSTSAGSTAASASAASAARAARPSSRASGALTRRSWIPVRCTIQSGSTPMRAAIDALETIASGTAMPSPAVQERGPSPFLRGTSTSDTGHLRQRALEHLGQDPAGAGLLEAVDSALVQVEDGLPPEHRAHQALGQAAAGI